MTKFVTVEGRTLKQAMKIITAIVERRNTIPILGHARLTHTAAGLSIAGTDLDIEVRTDIDVIDGAGGDWSICLSASILSRIASVAGAMNLRIEPAADSKATIMLGEGEAFYEIMTLPENDFPEMGGERGKLIEAFTNGMFAAMIDKVSWCASTEEVRYYLNGVCWHVTPKDRRFVATDGHRMAICKYVQEGGDASTRIIPRKMVSMISDHLAGKDVQIFAVDPGKIDIVAPGMTFRAKLIDGQYPDYQRVLPPAEKQVFAFDLKRDEIIAAVDQATVFGGDRMAAIKFTNKDGRAVIERRNPEFGTAKVKTSTIWPENNGQGQPEPFAFNSRYLREIARACRGQINLRMIDQMSPFSFHDEDATMTRVLMPMRA